MKMLSKKLRVEHVNIYVYIFVYVYIYSGLMEYISQKVAAYGQFVLVFSVVSYLHFHIYPKLSKKEANIAISNPICRFSCAMPCVSH